MGAHYTELYFSTYSWALMNSLLTPCQKTNRFMGEGDEDDSFDLLEDEDDTFSDEQGFTDDEPARELEVKNEKAELRSSTDYLGFAKNNRQKQLLKGMVKHLGQSFDPQRHDGATLMRFLRARQMDPSKASEMLKARIVGSHDDIHHIDNI